MSDNATGEYSIREPYKLPQGWRWEHWGALMVDFQQGLIRSNSQLGTGNVDYLKMGDLDSSGGYSTSNLAQTDATNDEITSYALSTGDFLLNVRNSMELVGKTCVVGEIGKRPLLFNHMLVRLKHRHDIPNSFINAFFSTEVGRKFIARCKQGTTTVIALYKRDLVQIPIPIPNDKTVKFISDFWVAIQRKIELNQRMNEELEGVAKLLYDYWFVQYDFPMSAAQAAALGKPHLTGHPYRASGGPMSYNETLKREIPEGWEVKEVGEVLAKESQTKKIPASEVLKSGRFPVVDQSKDFVCGFTNDGDAVIEGTPQIIFGDHTRILKFINFAFARGADGTQLLMSNTKRLPPPLFYQALQRIDLSSYGYARHFKFLKQSKVLLPEEDIAAKYERVAMSCYDLIRQNLVQTQELTTLRDWLLPMLMNGQVVVS